MKKDKYIKIGCYIFGKLTEELSGKPIQYLKHPNNINYSYSKGIWNLKYIGLLIYKINYVIKYNKLH